MSFKEVPLQFESSKEEEKEVFSSEAAQALDEDRADVIMDTVAIAAVIARVQTNGVLVLEEAHSAKGQVYKFGKQ
ncbi:hypothetical protein TYRP_009909 [Tyrophagus putrescentiae]|nr:hypothetical protein TYRP_023203 [Tyrophagus putrescentiae]KAH9410154.1 hypothetical protein TYRP_009909 [Tyrophagus putrescentiae]